LREASVTSAEDRRPEHALNLAFTSSGLERLGLPADELAAFSNEFVAGMTTPHRTRILGDVGESAPANWDWGGPAAPVDAVLLLYAKDEASLAPLEETPPGFSLVRRLGTADLDGFEPFGFRDGISQPFVEGLGKTGPREQTVRAGEFLLGYENEYGQTAEAPLLRNGSYLVFRQLRQDVPGFWRFADEATRRADGSSNPDARLRLAAKMVGRWPSGAPLALAPDADDPSLATANDFGYHDDDPRGARCPVGSHIRRSNPRDSLDPRPGSSRSFEVNRRHRIVRRGREYGPPLPLEQALAEPDTAERGLHFICLNANIARQFEFVNHTWLNNAKFGELYDDADPFFAPGCFTIPTGGVRERITDVPRFVSVKGGAYFFLPSLTALHYLAVL
ncbi:MAG TPA: Dyp-type peroxidase, partial [Gaiellaceae bacterium]|nr:Dyp-type peroxidase [Gaiellaceae bacterium]